ncbi:MAG TPA: hypothetical protein V6D47_05390 [Oscillatoriaceae cyanobacterium]
MRLTDAQPTVTPSPSSPTQGPATTTPTPSPSPIWQDVHSFTAKAQNSEMGRRLTKQQERGQVQQAANIVEQLPIAGNTQNAEDLLPTFAINLGKKAVTGAAARDGRIGTAGSFIQNFSEDHPTALSRLKVAGKLLGPVMAVGSTVWSTINLASRWDKMGTGEKIANTAGTAATAVGAGASIAALAHVPMAGTLAWGGLGAAGAIYQGINTWNEFHNPNKTAGQRDMSALSTGLQAAGTALLWTPVGMPMLVAGGVLSMFGDTIGKIPFVNDACKWINKKIGPAVKTVGKAVVGAAKAVGSAVSGAAHAVGHFFSSL